MNPKPIEQAKSHYLALAMPALNTAGRAPPPIR